MAAKKSKNASGGLTRALAAEEKRFRLCTLARSLVGSPESDVGKFLKVKTKSYYAKERWYCDWQQELADAGFQFARHFSLVDIEYSAFTNPDLCFDAYLLRGNRPSCQVIAYHDDQTATSAANFASVVGSRFAPPSRVWRHFKQASPAQLVAHLKKLVRGKTLLRIKASGCAARFKEVLNRENHEIGERALEVLKKPTLLIDGAAPRWERLGFYYASDNEGKKNRARPMADRVRGWQDDFAQAGANPPDRTDDGLSAAIHLAAASHLQLASAPDANELLITASDMALTHFRALAGAGKKEIVAHASFQLRALLNGLLLCALARRWETFKATCNLVQPKLVSADTADDEGLDFAQVLLLLVSSYRDRALPKAAALEQSVARRLAKVPRLHLGIWRAIAAGRAQDVEQALRSSLEYFMELRCDKLVPAQRLYPWKQSDPFRFIALPESLFYLAALERGITLPSLEPRFADMLITPDTIGIG